MLLPILLFYHGSSHFTLIMTVIYLFSIMILIWALTSLVTLIKEAIRKIMKLPPKEKKVFKYRKHIHFIAWPVFIVVACLYIYAIYYGFVEFDKPSPARRYFSTLDGLIEACKGRFLLPPPYIPDELNPDLNNLVTFYSVLHAGRRTAIGNYDFGYYIPLDLLEHELSELDKNVLFTSFGIGTYGSKLKDNDKIKEIDIGSNKAFFRYSTFYFESYGANQKFIELRFVGPRRLSFGNYVSLFKKQGICII